MIFGQLPPIPNTYTGSQVMVREHAVKTLMVRGIEPVTCLSVESHRG